MKPFFILVHCHISKAPRNGPLPRQIQPKAVVKVENVVWTRAFTQLLIFGEKFFLFFGFRFDFANKTGTVQDIPDRMK